MISFVCITSSFRSMCRYTKISQNTPQRLQFSYRNSWISKIVAKSGYRVHQEYVRIAHHLEIMLNFAALVVDTNGYTVFWFWLHEIHTMATIKNKYLWSQFLSQPSILEVITWTKKGRILWCWESISTMSVSRSAQRESLFWSLFGILTKNVSKVEQLKSWGRICNSIISVLGCFNIFRRLEFSDDLCLERIKEEFLGKKGDIDTFMALFEKHNEDFRKQVGVSVSATTLRKYELCKRHFAEFLKQKYGRTDIKLCELNYTVIYDFWPLSSNSCRTMS